MMEETLKIIIAEDSKPFIDGLKLLLNKYPHFEIIDICHNGLELIESPKLNNADLILSDIEMPIMNGIEAAKHVNYSFPNIKMIALTMHIEKVFVEDIIMAGFMGVIYKPEVSQKLETTIKKVMTNNYIIPENIKLK